ncbi:TonB-dependent receptor [Marivirga sp. S37H4]|uniref:TonB-dependent receptor n=1 Tax=Marivirga aurantiaca TaxID=2802615 RepID=A0A935CBK1_9BACT|nr:outer membrane beta-barrel family protein [Marivirga aurantiaca]MBK6266832.1 TonB-dependent receptor [Marivirga aurantiaca]
MKTLNLTIGIVAIMLFTVLHIQAQSISGKITDQNKEAVPFANVLLLNLPDSSLNTGVTSDMEGKFQLPLKDEGNFLMKISVMGLEEYYRDISHEESLSGFSLGEIKLSEKTEMLDAVEVKGKRPQFITYADKIVMDVENTSLHDGTTALETLSKSPGVWMDQDGELSVNGKKGVRVLLDGRPVYLSGSELKSMLEGMSAETIKNIEVINNPSSKYDAEGAGGVININFKKNAQRGVNGAVFSNYRYNGAHTNTAGLNLNGKKNQITYFVNADAGSRPFLRDMTARRTVEATDFELTQTVKDRRKLLNANLHVGVDYQMNDKAQIGLNYRGIGKLRDNNWDTRNNVREGSAQWKVNAFNNTKTEELNHTVNAFFQYQFTEHSKLNVDGSFADLNTYGTSTFKNYFTMESSETYEKLSTENPSSFDIYSIQTDYTHDLPENDIKLEAGFKYSVVNSDNDLEFYINEGDDRFNDPDRTNNFEYREQISASYIDINKKFSNKTTVKGGMRIENTQMLGTSLQSEQGINRDFTSFFPSIFIQQKWTDNYETNFSYSRRISRPRYIFLNPSIMYTDPYSYIQGNPALKPMFTDGISFTQVIAQQFNITIGYDIGKDFIGELPLVDPETNQTVFNIGNIDQMQNANLSILAPVQITDFWQSNSQAIFSYQKFKSTVEGVGQLNAKSMFNIRSTHNISLPNDFKLEVLASYQSPHVYGLYNMDGFWFMDMSIKRSFLNDKLDVSASVNDIFRTYKYNGSSNINGNETAVGQYQYQQGFRLNLRYKFSLGDKFKSNQKQIDLEELQRAGGA